MTTTRFTSRDAIHPTHAAGMDTAALRENFLIDDLFTPGAISLTYTHYDRMIVGGAVPTPILCRLRPSGPPAPKISSIGAN